MVNGAGDSDSNALTVKSSLPVADTAAGMLYICRLQFSTLSVALEYLSEYAFVLVVCCFKYYRAEGSSGPQDSDA